MAGLNEILSEISRSQFDTVRQNYLAKLSKYTKRHTISYYSASFTKQGLPDSAAINDGDVSGLMNACHGLTNRETTGLDLILHTPLRCFGCHRSNCLLSEKYVW